MNEETSNAGLRAALERATDQVDPPHLAATALARAQRRRSRRSAGVAVGAAASVAVLVGLLALPRSDDEQRPAEPVGPSESHSPQPSVTTALPPPVSPEAIQGRWDPFTVVEEPLHPTVLPATLAPPTTSVPSVADQPMTAAVVAWPEEGRDLMLLGTDGAWRSVPATADAVSGMLLDGTNSGVVDPALSPDGRKVAMSTDDGILVVDVTTGRRHTIPWAERLGGPWDRVPGLAWLPDDEGFVVRSSPATWLVSPDGNASKAPYARGYAGNAAVAPDGTVVERRWEQRDLRVWEGRELVGAVQFPFWGDRLAAGFGRLAMTGGGSSLPGDGGPMVFDTETGELLAHVPMRDPSSVYSDNGYLTAQGFLDPDTVLLLVGPMDFRTMEAGEESWHLVAWDITTGDFERLTSGDTRMRGIELATGVLVERWSG